MAIFHLSHKVISRGQGQSIVAAAAYQSRSRLYDERDGHTKDYHHKTDQELLFSGIYAPKNAPDWAHDREDLWNAAERAEDEHNRTRAKSAITGRHIEIALMNELTPEQNRYALQDFIREHFTRHGYAVDLNIHGPDREGDARNIHAHLLISQRTLNEQGFNAKKLQMDRQEMSECVTRWRDSWAKTANRHLERHGHPARIDARSLEDQGLDREATQHLGPTATEMERNGQASERGDQNREIADRNQQHWRNLSELHRELAEVKDRIRADQGQVFNLNELNTPVASWWRAAERRAEQLNATPIADIHTPTVEWWKAECSSARASYHAPQEPMQAHAQASPQPTQEAAQRATQRPTQEFEQQKSESRLDRILREREEQRQREAAEERQPGRSIADEWQDKLRKGPK